MTLGVSHSLPLFLNLLCPVCAPSTVDRHPPLWTDETPGAVTPAPGVSPYGGAGRVYAAKVGPLSPPYLPGSGRHATAGGWA